MVWTCQENDYLDYDKNAVGGNIIRGRLKVKRESEEVNELEYLLYVKILPLGRASP